MRIADACIRYYMGIDPDTLSDEDWAMRWEEIKYIRTEEAKGKNG